MASIATAGSMEIPASTNTLGVAGTTTQSVAKTQLAKWKQDLISLVVEVRVLTLLLKHPRVPWLAKVAAGCAVGYLVSPIQLIPTFIPVIGQLDDLFVLFLGMKAARKMTPACVIAECEAQARSTSLVSPVESVCAPIPS